MQRKLLFFFDGTSKATIGLLNNNPTNMYRLNQAFTNGRDGEQISFYYSGVGTRGDRLSAYTGKGFDQIVTKLIRISPRTIEAEISCTSSGFPEALWQREF